MAAAATRAAVSGYLRTYHLAPRYRTGERMTLSAADGVPIAATLLRASGSTPAPATVVVVHGFVGWSRNPAIHRFATTLAEHFDVVVPDLRGHGRSGGHCTFGVDEALDVDAAVRAAPTAPVYAVGVSLGAAAVICQAAIHGGVAGVVAVSGPAWWGRADGEAAVRISRWVHNRAGRALLAAVVRTKVGAQRCRPTDPAEAAAGLDVGFTVVVHDAEDRFFGPEHAEALHAAAPAPKDLWWVEGQGHGTDLLTPDLAARVVERIRADVVARSAGATRSTPSTPSTTA